MVVTMATPDNSVSRSTLAIEAAVTLQLSEHDNNKSNGDVFCSDDVNKRNYFKSNHCLSLFTYVRKISYKNCLPINFLCSKCDIVNSMCLRLILMDIVYT